MAETKRRTPAIFDRQLGEHFPGPKVNAFVLFQEPPPPANPVIPFRVRLLSELDVVPLPEGSHPRYLPFPYLDASLFPASPVIGLRYGRPLLDDPQLLVGPQRFPFPYFQAVLAAANPVIAYRMRQLAELGVEPIVAFPQRFPFPYFEQPAPAPANSVIPFLMRRMEELAVEAVVARPQFYPLVPGQFAPVAPGRAIYIPIMRPRRR